MADRTQKPGSPVAVAVFTGKTSLTGGVVVAWALTWNAKPKRALGASTPFRLDLVVYAASC